MRTHVVSMLIVGLVLCLVLSSGLPWGCGVGSVGDREPALPAPEPGIRVYVRDAETGSRIAGATVTATGDKGDELLVASYESGPYTGVFEPGTYVIRVEKGGYESASVEDIRVLVGRWAYQNFIPVDVDVRLASRAAATGGSGQ